MLGHKDKLPPYLLQLCREFRKHPTNSEEMLWLCLRNRQLHGMKFRRQHAIGRYIADFYSHDNGLIIEIDGGIHALPDKAEMDAVRRSILESGGYRILRFTSDQVESKLETVLQLILQARNPSPPAPLPRGEGRTF